MKKYELSLSNIRDICYDILEYNKYYTGYEIIQKLKENGYDVELSRSGSLCTKLVNSGLLTRVSHGLYKRVDDCYVSNDIIITTYFREKVLPVLEEFESGLKDIDSSFSLFSITDSEYQIINEIRSIRSDVIKLKHKLR